MTWIHQHYEVIGILFAVITAVLAWLQLRKTDPLRTSLTRSLVDHSAIISGSHNNIVVGQAAPAKVEAVSHSSEKPSPNLVYSGARRKNVFVNPWPDGGICEPRTTDERAKSLNALVLKLENRRGERKISRAMNVIAKLKFRHQNGATERDIDYGVWLNSPCNSTNIGIGDTRELVLLCVLNGTLITFEDKRVDSLDFRAEGFSYIETCDIDQFDRVDITLIDQTTQAYLHLKLKFWREGASFCTSEV